MRQHDDRWYSPYLDRAELAAEFGTGLVRITEQRQAALEHRLRAAADPASATLLGWLLRWRGRDDEAAEVLRRADAAGDPEATLLLAELVGRVWWVSVADRVAHRGPRSYRTCTTSPYEREWSGGGQPLLERAAAGGNAEALMILGRQLEWAGRYPDAADRLRRAAELGLAGAAARLGRLLARPDTGVTDRYAAGDWLRRAAEDGYLPGITALIEWLDSHFPDRVAERERWLRRAAELRHLPSTVRLAEWSDAAGRLDEAEAWYRQATDLADELEHLDVFEAFAALLRRRGRPADIAGLRTDALRIIDDRLATVGGADEREFLRELRAETARSLR